MNTIILLSIPLLSSDATAETSNPIFSELKLKFNFETTGAVISISDSELSITDLISTIPYSLPEETASSHPPIFLVLHLQ